MGHFWIDPDLGYIMGEERSLSYINKCQSYFYDAFFLNYGEMHVQRVKRGIGLSNTSPRHRVSLLYFMVAAIVKIVRDFTVKKMSRRQPRVFTDINRLLSGGQRRCHRCCISSPHPPTRTLSYLTLRGKY